MEIKGKNVLAVILLTSVFLNYCVSIPVEDRENSYVDLMWLPKIVYSILPFLSFSEEHHPIKILPTANTSIEKSISKSPWYISSHNELKLHKIDSRAVSKSKRSGNFCFNIIKRVISSINKKEMILTLIVSSSIATNVAKNRIDDVNAAAVAVAKPSMEHVKTSFKIFKNDGSVIFLGNNASLVRIKRSFHRNREHVPTGSKKETTSNKSSYYRIRKLIPAVRREKRAPTIIMKNVTRKNSAKLTIGGRSKRLAPIAYVALEVLLWSIGMSAAGVVGGVVVSSIESDKQFSDLEKRRKLIEGQLTSACQVYNKGCILGHCWANCGPR